MPKIDSSSVRTADFILNLVYTQFLRNPIPIFFILPRNKFRGYKIIKPNGFFSYIRTHINICSRLRILQYH